MFILTLQSVEGLSFSPLSFLAQHYTLDHESYVTQFVQEKKLG